MYGSGYSAACPSASIGVPLDRAGQRFLRRWDRAVRAEFHPRRRDRRFCPGMEAFGGRVLCAAHRIPPDRGIRDFASWKCGKLPLCRWKTHSQPMEKDKSFPTACKQVSHSACIHASLHTFPQRLLLRISILSFILEVEKNTYK